MTGKRISPWQLKNKLWIYRVLRKEMLDSIPSRLNFVIYLQCKCCIPSSSFSYLAAHKLQSHGHNYVKTVLIVLVEWVLQLSLFGASFNFFTQKNWIPIEITQLQLLKQNCFFYNKMNDIFDDTHNLKR